MFYPLGVYLLKIARMHADRNTLTAMHLRLSAISFAAANNPASVICYESSFELMSPK